MYIDTVMNYTGSKFKLLEQILPLFDYKKSTFIDLFCGGGSVYTNIVDKYDIIIINDIINDIINIHKELAESDDIINSTKELCIDLKESQEAYLKLRDEYNKNNTASMLWALILSCNSNMMRFNKEGLFNQTWGKRSWNKNTDKKVEIFKNHIREYKNKIQYQSSNFNAIDLITNAFYYIDPPYGYCKEGDSISNKQISEAGYNAFYYQKDDINLYNYCKDINNIGSTFMLSGVLEHGGKRSWLLDKLISEGFRYVELNYEYEKINKTNSNKQTKEIIIMNYE